MSRFIALMVLILALWPLSAQANVTLKRHADLLPIELQSALDTSKPLTDPTFNILITEDVTYHNTTLPKGSILCGAITRMRSSKRFGRPAFVKISFQQIILPDQTVLTLEPTTRQAKADMIIEPDKNRSFTHFVVENVLLENASLLVSGPLALSDHMSIALFNLVDTTAGVVMGAGYGVIQSHRNAVDKADATPELSQAPANNPRTLTSYSTLVANNPTATPIVSPQPLETKPHQVRNVIGGIYESVSPIPPFWVLATKAPNIHYQPGDTIRVALTPAGLHHIMPVLSSASKIPSTPPQPVAVAPSK